MHPLEHMALTSWQKSLCKDDQEQAIEVLESGRIILFPGLNFTLNREETHFLSDKYTDPNVKNISYDFHTDHIQGAICSSDELLHLKNMMKQFALQTKTMMQQIFPRYIAGLELGRTSFRPVEAQDRQSHSAKKDDTKLHVDAFPSSPTQGKRILRVFSNVNPMGEPRVWRVGQPFREVVAHFFQALRKPYWGESWLLKMLRATRTYRTPYDHFMLRLHHKMKLDPHYQATVPKTEVNFPAASTWVVFTDQVSHAVMRGQYAFEQTFYLPVSVLKNEGTSPLRVLEEYAGFSLV